MLELLNERKWTIIKQWQKEELLIQFTENSLFPLMQLFFFYSEWMQFAFINRKMIVNLFILWVNCKMKILFLWKAFSICK